jgi:AcrR family transcriptional regulator
MSTTPYRAPADNDTVDRIVGAARRRFREKTVAKTWMADVADEVGLARQSLYSFVAGRRELVELALVARCSELAPRFMLKPGVVISNVPDAFVEMTATMVECTRGDEEFLALATALPREHLFAVLAGPSRIREMVIDSLAPVLDAAGDRGMLRDSLSRRDMCAWVQTVLTSLAGRPDLDAASLRATLRNYLVPAVLVA